MYAVKIYQEAIASRRQLVTSNYVINELVRLAQSRMRSARSDLFSFVDRFAAQPLVNMIHIDAATHARAWDLLKKMEDKEWSLVDASSFILMRDRGMYEALTTDHHVAQAGFQPMLTGRNT